MIYYIGALIGTFLIMRLFLWLVHKVMYRKRISRKDAVIPAFIISALFTFIAHVPHFELDSTFKYVYLPCLVWWFVYERYLNTKLNKKYENAEIQTDEDDSVSK
jgi:hypothetical protein